MSTGLPTDYQTFIHTSRYARWIDKENRRETWAETVTRYMNFMREHLNDNLSFDMGDVLYDDLYKAIFNLEIMPSMRLLMTAGPAAKRDHVCAYNCAYLPVDSLRSFDEAMYILLCGTGVGFSVEQQYVSQLPLINEHFEHTDTTLVVEDSKGGWAKALRELLSLLYAGQIPTWDVSRVRPAGARLKTFGGRASGPAPLVKLFKFVVAKVRAAAGRRLTTTECHDIMCMIGEVVVVGGVRRSAMISLSDLHDDRMRNAKAGNWWVDTGYRALANNSWVANERPDIGTFMSEWKSLYDSKSGERGLFSRIASQRIVARNGRRDASHDFGTNPCSEIILRPYQFCNLTEVVVREDDDHRSLFRKTELATILGTFQSTLTTFKYLRNIWKRNTEEERLLGVSMTGILDNAMMNDLSEDSLIKWTLDCLRLKAVDVNRDYAVKLGIPQSAAITCVKPSGTVSQLVDSASGIHARHDPFYIRRVRQDAKDPLTAFLIAQGVPNERCVMKPDDTVIFSFPMKSPKGAVTREELSALEHLELVLTYQRHWTEHKPSVTVYVKEHEWMEVGAWVYRNFDEVSGISFLPHDGGTYRQAPYETITEAEYEAALTAMPTVQWDKLKEFELEDSTTSSQELACTAGGCSI